MPVTGIIATIGIAVAAFAGAVLPTPEPPEILTANVQVISPTPTPTNTPTPTPTPTNTPTPTPTATPTPPPPTPTSIPYTSDDLERWFSQYAGEYGVDRELLRKIARCESGFNAGAYNPAGYAGMFQFAAATWQSTRGTMGMDGNPDLRYNAEESIRTAAFKISRGGAGAWPVCSTR